MDPLHADTPPDRPPLDFTLREFQTVFEAAGVGMIVMQGRTMRRCNRALERMFGYPPGALDNQSTQLLHPDLARWEQLGERIRATMRADQTYQDECELQRRDGSRFWVRRSGCALISKDPLAGTIWVYEDITAQREAAHTMQRAKELAEQAARTQSEFLANMRHEFRTPMNNILGLTQIALRSGLPTEQREQVQRILRSAQHLFGILTDMLDLSAIEAGQLTLGQRPFAPHALVQAVLTEAREAADAKGLALAAEVDAALPPALAGDAQQIQRIASIYVHNAIKFTAQGGIRVVARALSDDPQGVQLRLEVHDTGIGIAPDEQARLFEPFARADNSTTQRHGGTGLGLSLCRALARRMDGHVGVASQLGDGAQFWLVLRLPLAHEAPAPLLPAADSGPAQPAAPSAPVAAPLTAQATALLDRLDRLLGEDDAEALEWMAQHAALLAPVLGDGLPAFNARVHAFEFDTARSQLQAARLAR